MSVFRVEKTDPDSFLKIVLYASRAYNNLNKQEPCYENKKVNVISIIPVGNDKDGNPLFCYELKSYLKGEIKYVHCTNAFRCCIYYRRFYIYN